MFAVMVVLLVACARPSYFMRTGDAAYKRGDYATALKNYETEQRYRPSKNVTDKISATKLKLVEKELAPIETAFADGRFDDGVTALIQLDAQTRKQPPVQAFVKKQEQRLRDELAARAGRKEWGRAFVLGSRAVIVFPAIADKLPEYARGWADELRPAIADADAKQKEGESVLRRAALAVATGDPNDLAQAKRALVALRAKYALALEVRGKGDVARVQSALASDDRFALSNANASRGKVIVTLGAPTENKTTSRGRESKQVQKGTRTVENPDYEAAQLNLKDKEDALANWKRQKADEMNSPTRTKESIEGYDYPIQVAQQDVDYAREDLQNTPTTIQEPNFVDVEFDVETHTLTVARDVSLDVSAAWKGDLTAQRENVKLATSDKAHAANSAAGVGRDPVELPAASALGPDLDRAVVKWLDGGLRKVTGQYYRSMLVDPKLGLPLVVALYPQGTQPQHRKELEKTLGVPMADSLLDALAHDKLASVFTEPDGSKPAAGVATASAKATATAPAPAPANANPNSTKKTAAVVREPAAPAPKPSIATKSRPSPEPAPAPAVPADPMLAKAGFALTIAPFTYQKNGKVVLQVSSDGTLTTGTTKIAVLRANGTVEDPQGKIVLAISKNGDVWMPRQQAPSGKLTSSTLSFDRGANVTIDTAGRVKINTNGVAKVSEAMISPNNAKVKASALVVAWLGVGKLGMRDAK